MGKLVNFSNTLAMEHTIEIGLLLLASSSSPSLKGGVMRAHFHIFGISLVDNKRLNKPARGYIRTLEANLMNLFSKPSSPGLLCVFNH